MAEDSPLSRVNVEAIAETGNLNMVSATGSITAVDSSVVDASGSAMRNSSSTVPNPGPDSLGSVDAPASSNPRMVNGPVTVNTGVIDARNLSMANTNTPSMMNLSNPSPATASAGTATSKSNMVDGPTAMVTGPMHTALIPLPPVEAALFRLEPPPGWSETTYLPFRHPDGFLVVDEKENNFKDFAFLPRVIPSAKSPAHMLELWLGKSDSKIQSRDLFVRMNPAPTSPKLAANAINMQRVRFRTQFNIPCWTKRPAVPSQVECLIYEQLTWDSVIHNTILPVLKDVGLVMPALPGSLTATRPLILPLTTYTGGLRPHAPSLRVKHIFTILGILQNVAYDLGYPHWIFLENKHKPDTWSHKADCQQHPMSGPDDIAVPSFSDIPEAARAWIVSCVKEAARNRSFWLQLSKLPEVSRKQVHGYIAEVAVELNQPIESLLPVDDLGTVLNPPRTRARPSVQSTLSSQSMPSSPRFRNIRPEPSSQSTQSVQSVQSLQPTQNTLPMPKNQSAQGSKTMKKIQTPQAGTEDEWTDTSSSDTEMEEMGVNNNHNALVPSDVQQVDDEDEWTDISGSDMEMEDIVAETDHAVLGTSEVDQGRISATPAFVAVNKVNDQLVPQLATPDDQQGQTSVVGKRPTRAKSTAANGSNNEGVLTGGLSDGQASVMGNPTPVNTNGNQLVGATMATGNTAVATYISPYSLDSAKGGFKYDSYLDQFNQSNAGATYGPPVSAVRNCQGVQGNTEIPSPAAHIRRRPAPNGQGITDNLQLPPVVHSHPTPLVAAASNGPGVQGIADTLQRAPVIHRHPAPFVATTQTDQRVQGNVVPSNPTGFIRRRPAPSAAVQRAREAQHNAESFDPASFIRRRVATESAIPNQQQGRSSGGGPVFHAAMIGPYLERFYQENAHLVHPRSKTDTQDDQPAKGNKRRKL